MSPGTPLYTIDERHYVPSTLKYHSVALANLLEQPEPVAVRHVLRNVECVVCALQRCK